MRRLWFHIGSHKTGTTSVQMALNAADQAGALHDVVCRAGNMGRIGRLLVQTSGAGAAFQPHVDWDAVEACLPDQGDTILSSELFFWIYDAGEIARLADLLRPRFDEIRIIVYLRRQDQLALSHRKQVGLGFPAADFYGVRVAALPAPQPHFARYFDYAAKLAMWADAFGEEAMIVRRYEPAHLEGGDVVRDVFALIGQPAPPVQTLKNTALGRKQLLVALALQAHEIARPIIRQIINAPMDPAVGQGRMARMLDVVRGARDDARRLLPARAQAQAFLAPYAQSNRHLAQRYAPDGPPEYFDGDFARYPRRGNDAFDLSSPAFEALLARARAAS